MTQEILPVGVIGCGGFCTGTHLPNLQRNPHFRIRALCDLNADLLAALNQQYHPEYSTDDFRKLFDDPSIGLIVCATGPKFRLPIMRAAAASGKPLFVEKPLCLEPEELLPMVRLMTEAKGQFMVGFNRPFSPMMQDAVRYFRQYRSGNTTIIYRIVGEARLWPEHHYYAVINRRESTILHEATHIFHLLNYLTGSFPTRVYTAGGGNVDNIITLDYPDRTTAVIIAGDNSSAGFPKEYLEINTGYSTIAGYNFAELNVFGSDGVRHHHTYPYRQQEETVDTGREEAELRHWLWRRNVTEEDIRYGYYYDKQVYVDKGHYNELEVLRRCILEGRPSPVDAVQGAAANLIAWAAIEAHAQGQPIRPDFSTLQPSPEE